MIEAAPRVPKNQNHGRFHPINLLIVSINGIAGLEHWRQNAQPNPESDQARIDTIRAKESVRTLWHDRKMEVKSLELGAIRDKTKEGGWREAQRSYHFDRAKMFGERALDIEQKKPRFSSLRLRFLENRQKVHKAKAQKAASKLLTLS